MKRMENLTDRLRVRLERIYGGNRHGLADRIAQMAEDYKSRLASKPPWDESDVVLITYGDQVREAAQPALATLKSFLLEHGLQDAIEILHLLPIYPYSSDDGFSVIDYRRVDAALGDWPEVAALEEEFDLMFDLVLNHCSRQSAWFDRYRSGAEPYVRFFIEVDPAADLSGVTRPRSLPLLTEVDTSRGKRHVWTTFSEDQVDLNFAESAVLLEMLDILLFYIEQGARIIRLDAIAYLWKEIGTSCIHLPQTHEVVKLMRDLVDEVAPGTLLLTETNVPHRENVSYFGDGDEAHMVYQFSLAPLLLDAYLQQDAMPFRNWLAGLEPSPPGTTYFNFTASHDGIGVRPLEGLVSPDRFDRLVDAVRQRGGRVNTRRNPDGSDTPYELNITYFDALGEPGGMPRELHVRRFLATQAVMLALRGIPGVYFHSLVGTPNDYEGVARTGINRAINRRKYHRSELQELLAAEDSTQRLVFEGYRRLLAIRRTCAPFHPDGDQQVLDVGDPGLLALMRISPSGSKRIVIAANVTGSVRELDLRGHFDAPTARDLLTGDPPSDTKQVVLEPYQVVWLTGE